MLVGIRYDALLSGEDFCISLNEEGGNVEGCLVVDEDNKLFTAIFIENSIIGNYNLHYLPGNHLYSIKCIIENTLSIIKKEE